MTSSNHHRLTHATTGQPFPWLFAYFRQIYGGKVDVTPEGVQSIPLTEENLLVEALHLAYSRDGLHWTPLNDNRPVLHATGPGDRIRDPFVQRGYDGNFHLLATTGWAATDIYYARSTDLLHWDDQRCLSVMASVPGARNAWAPEFIFDPDQQSYVVYWSSSHGRYGWDDSRIWYSRTTDFQRFSPPQVLFDPGFTVIDATIVPFEGRFYMFFKDERFGYQHGEHRYIQAAAAPNLEGPYTIVTEAVTSSITEGPAVMQAQDGPWFLYFDRCMDNAYGVSVGDDLLHWQEAPDADFPPNARHGSILAITEEELAVLRHHYQQPPSSPPVLDAGAHE